MESQLTARSSNDRCERCARFFPHSGQVMFCAAADFRVQDRVYPNGSKQIGFDARYSSRVATKVATNGKGSGLTVAASTRMTIVTRQAWPQVEERKDEPLNNWK